MDEAEYDVKEGSSGPLTMESLSSNGNGHAPSADDLAWADSCLVRLTEASETDWGSFKESLLEILNVPTEPVSLLSVDNGMDDYVEIGDNYMVASSESGAAAFPMMTDDHSDFTDKDEESRQEGEDSATDDPTDRKKKEMLKQKKLIENALLPDHAEFARVESSDSGFDLGSLTFEAETSSANDIFRVWDLGVSDEQDDFTKTLSHAFEKSSSPAVTSNSGFLAVEPLDDLVTAISELSLGLSSN